MFFNDYRDTVSINGYVSRMAIWTRLSKHLKRIEPHLAQITDGSMCFKSFEAVLYIMT